MTKDLHTEKINALLHTKDEIIKSNFMFPYDAVKIIDMLINEMEYNKRLWYQLQHAWQHNGDYIEYEKAIVN